MVFRRGLVLVVFRIILAALLVSSDLPFYKTFTKIFHPVLKNLLCRIPFICYVYVKLSTTVRYLATDIFSRNVYVSFYQHSVEPRLYQHVAITLNIP